MLVYFQSQGDAPRGHGQSQGVPCPSLLTVPGIRAVPLETRIAEPVGLTGLCRSPCLLGSSGWRIFGGSISAALPFFAPLDNFVQVKSPYSAAAFSAALPGFYTVAVHIGVFNRHLHVFKCCPSSLVGHCARSILISLIPLSKRHSVALTSKRNEQKK